MNDLNNEACGLYSKLQVFKRKEKEATKNIKEMLSVVKNPYIAFSCGKDSSVLADMILQINPRVPLRFISSGETRILHNVDDVLDYFVKKYNAKIEEINFDRVWTEEWKDATFDEQRKAGRRDIQSIDNSSFDGVFMGLRIDESRARSISLKKCHTDGTPKFTYKYNNKNFYRLCPLALWKTEDIGAYITKNSIPVLNWYREFGFESRTTARLTGDSLRQSTLFYIKATNPAGYAKLIRRFPELSVLV